MPLGGGGEPAGVVERRLHVVDAARADDDHQPVVGAAEDVDDFAAPLHDSLLALLAQRQLGEQRRRRRQLDDPLDPLVADPIAGALFGPDHHLVFTFLQSLKILLPMSVRPLGPRTEPARTSDGARPKRCMSVRRDAARPDA